MNGKCQIYFYMLIIFLDYIIKIVLIIKYHYYSIRDEFNFNLNA